jgi:tetratricopeptide (TPR) repeat protein
MWMIKLTLVAEEDLNTHLPSLLEGCEYTDANILLSELILKAQKYDKCRKYFENLLHIYRNKHEDLAAIYYSIALTYHEVCEYDKSIVNGIKACDSYFTL